MKRKFKKISKKVFMIALLAGMLTSYTVISVGAISDSVDGNTTLMVKQNVYQGKLSIIGTVNGNWDTDTPMTDDDGDGIYTATLNIMAGSYEYKVREDCAWDEAWGATNDEGISNAQGGANATINLDADATVLFSIDTNNSKEYWSISYEIINYDGFSCIVNDDDTITVALYLGIEEDVTIPSKIDGKVVTKIGDYTFSNYSQLTSVIIPDTITEIGKQAFWGCSSLTDISIPSSVKKIGVKAFSHSRSLTSITIPYGVTEIGEKAFWGCTSLTSITIPDTVTSIDSSVFSECSSLTSVIIPNSITSIGDEAFYNCGVLTSVTIPDSVTEIGKKALGYDYVAIKVPNFTIYGVEGSEAERYAIDNEFIFIKIDNTDGNTSDNVEDNTDGNTSDNVEDNTNDNTSGNVEDNTDGNTSDNVDNNTNSNIDDNISNSTNTPQTGEKDIVIPIMSAMALSGIGTIALVKKRKKN